MILLCSSQKKNKQTLINYNIDNIRIIITNDVIQVINNRKSDIKVDFINLRKNYAPYFNTLAPNIFVKTYYTNWDIRFRNDNEIYICLLYDKITIVKYDKKQNKIFLLDKSIDFKDLTTPPIIIHGVPGGGTSLITKMLRYFGMFVGDDAGDFENRKTHESILFRFINYYQKFNNLEPNEKGFKKFRDMLYNSPNELYFNDKTVNNIDVWGFKIFAEDTHLFFSDNFKDCKFLSVMKSPKNSINRSREGLAFSNMNEIDALDRQILKLEGNKLFCVDYYKFFEDYNYVNKVLNFCNIKKRIMNEEHFRMVLKEIKYEGKINF